MQCISEFKRINVLQQCSFCLPLSNSLGEGGGEGGVLPINGLMGMCRWMGSHLHDWIDYNGVAFSTELLEWGRR